MGFRSAAVYCLAIVLVSSLLAACNFPNRGESSPTSPPDLEQIVSGTRTALAFNQNPTSRATESIQETLTPPSLTLEPSATSSHPTETQQSDCGDAAKFVSETIPDESLFSPGDVFTKTWRLQNAGTCIWNSGYTLFFHSGDQMDGESPASLPAIVPPQEYADIVLRLKAPQKPGIYQGNWLFRNAAGKPFGTGLNADQAFWVRISVSGVGQSQDLGDPDWQDNFDADLKRWYLPADNNIQFEIKDGQLVMTAFKPDGDQWRLAELPALSDFYIEMEAITGDACAKKDSYGFLLRSPKSSGSVVDTGYVFGFSCDGNYRYYRMDSGNYVSLQNWKPTPFLKQGPNQTNKIGVRAEGDAFTIYVNGNEVDSFNDSTYPEGLFGLMIRSEQTDNFQVAVEQMAYWSLP